MRADRAPLLRLSCVIAALIAVALVSRAQDTAGSPASTGQASGAKATAGQAARSAAQTHLGLLSGGDWSAAWEGWSSSAQRHVPRDTYVRTHRICHPLLAVPFQTVRAVPLDRRTVDIGWQGGEASGTLRMVSERGVWRVAPTRTQLARYENGPDAAVAALRGRGECDARQAEARTTSFVRRMT
ncbi:hypothetical protein J7E96_20240 [Streptomyces sp. ISL-96]|uniref:hypothetical protein n=1 Tax=Streptomyces sp. ISL-96 TaxID=2819191 RepID=UPI001BEC9804|nr:hypothetical protein [Streptomyces sp. ISL-96]MBT2490802.1 hypothetical protein [Streptomyces sp. ISL-96]